VSPGVPRVLKRSQRERLIDAMVELCTHGGYHEVSITECCSHAGVSSESFYEQFQGKEECFLAAYEACGERILAPMRALAGESTDLLGVAHLALEQLLRGLERDPDAGRLLFVEALGGGPLIRAGRERVFAEFERGTDELLTRTAGLGTSVDLSLTALIGALRHIISRHLRTHSEDQLPALLEDGVAWLSCYAVPAGAGRWSTSPEALLEDAPTPSPPTAWAPETMPRGAHGLPASVIARSQHTRIMYATAEVTMAKGYQKTKISDIVAAARVARTVFYEHFASKEEAFLEAQQFPTQYILDSCAEAYFSVDEWPARIWRGLQTLLWLIAQNPAISHLRLVECYAVGPAAIRRAEEITRSFTLFMPEGFRYHAKGAPPPRLASQAIAGAIFEIIKRQVEEGEFATLPALLPQLAYIAIAPFTGAQEAIALVEDMKARESLDARKGPGSEGRRCGRSDGGVCSSVASGPSFPRSGARGDPAWAPRLRSSSAASAGG
jgi:AcrR family transcriptional regulator